MTYRAIVSPRFAARIARIVTFRDPGLFKLFGLPHEYRAAPAPEAAGPADRVKELVR
jgi:hypothetical protein